jgi:hypothetical protein
LAGTPSSDVNDRKIRGILDQVRQKPASLGNAPFLIPPARRDFLRTAGDMATDRPFPWIPEWMPMITCIGMFDSSPRAGSKEMHGSTLTIIWFQDDYAMPIADSGLQAIKAIDWDSHALDFEY